MRDDMLLKRIPMHVPEVTPQVTRLINKGQILGVLTPNEEGMNLYPRPR